MTRTQPDIDALVEDCADEPIRIPGSVQPHGVLLAADAGTLAVVVASASVRTHLDRTPEELLGTRLPDLFGQSWPTDGLHSLDPAEPHRLQVVVGGVRRTFDALAHEADGLVVVELEPPAPEPEEVAVRARASLRALQDAGTGPALTRTIAQEVRALTGFDRVMVYRFDEHWHGTVVAEDARADLGLDSYLGLRFPASDIPAQARALYTAHWLRSIPDAGYTPSPLVPSFHPETGAPLDLSASALRSVSPVHLQYLANMGVAASMSVSLVTHGRLWGLIACHHYSGPHYPTQAERGAAEFLGRTASVLLEGDEHRRRYLGSLGVGATAGNLAALVTTHDREPLTALTRDGLLLELVEGATGAMVRLNGRTASVGTVPEAADARALLGRLWPTAHRAPVATASVRTLLDVDGRDAPDAADDAALATRLAPTASGVLALPVQSGSAGDALVWFKPEVLAEVRWAGDPQEKGLEVTPAGLRLTPRASFDTYVELVRGTSTPFDAVEVEAAERLATTVGDVLVRRAAEDARLAGALQQLMLTARPPVPDGYAV
ncbi:MAG: GAF domain-containing protein, partial [Actinotalea sp.]|nr:GAF domain-containing protein [Actinotalea sp.]